MATTPVAMLTTEVAELTGKQHDHVMRDARKMLDELHGEEAAPKFGDSYRGADSTVRPCYRLPKRELMVLVIGYSVAMRAASTSAAARWRGTM